MDNINKNSRQLLVRNKKMIANIFNKDDNRLESKSKLSSIKTIGNYNNNNNNVRTLLFIIQSSLLILILSCNIIVLQIDGFPYGAPEMACKELKPGHGVEPTSGTPPFELSQDKLQVEANDQIKVTLSSASKTTFKGLIVQAINEKGETIGKFLPGKGLKTLDSCSAVTHSDREDKKTANLVWEAPADLKTKEAVMFKATVVHKFDQYYMNIKSTLATRR